MESLQKTWPQVQEILQKESYLWSSASALTTPSHIVEYSDWIAKNYHGDMKYLADHEPFKKDPKTYFTDMQSVISVGISYVPHPEKHEVLKNARVALYAKGFDYHHWLKKKLSQSCAALSESFPEAQFLAVTDSTPLLERDFAANSGVAWIGKNTCLITRSNGSFFLIGEILTSLALREVDSQPSHDFCGTCTRCLEACPTGAFVKPRVMDAKLCISYLTIESRKIPELPLREKMGDWLFGCDICQSVCPWNHKFLPALARESSAAPRLPLALEERAGLVEDLRFLLTASGKQIEKLIFGTALQRAGSFGLRRNSLIVVGNMKLKELAPEVETLKANEKLNELANWALTKLNSD